MSKKIKKKKEKKENYLDNVFSHAAAIEWDCDEKGNVTLIVENKGFFNRIAQKLIKKPEKTRVHLDKIGSFIWMRFDGTRSVYEIAMEVKREFGQKADPLYDRLLTYMEMLREQGFIH